MGAEIYGEIDYERIKKKILEIINSNQFRVVIIDNTGVVISDTPLSDIYSAMAKEATLDGIKAQTDKLTFDDLSSLFSNRLDSVASLRDPLDIPEGDLFQIPKGQTVIVKDYVNADGDLYAEGDLLVV